MAEENKKETIEAPAKEAETKAAPEVKKAAPLNYHYTSAEDKVSTKKGEHQVKVSKTVDLVDESKPIISETVSHKFQGKKQETSNTKVTIDTYSDIGGHRTQTTEFGHEDTYYDKNKKKIKTMVESTSEKTENAGDGALADTVDKTSAYHFGYNRVKTTTFNKDETVSSIRSHEENRSTSSNSQTDEYTEMKKDEVKKCLRAEGNSARIVVTAIENKKKKDFFAERTAKGEEYYLNTTKSKSVQISVKDGKMSGKSFKLDESGQNVVSEKELSQKQLKKELKSMRKEADQTVAKVSSAKTADEYLSAIPAPSSVAQVNLSDIFHADQKTLKEKMSEVKVKQQPQVQEHASVTAEQILQRKMQEIKQH